MELCYYSNSFYNNDIYGVLLQAIKICKLFC
ncbi:protein of unknown function [Rhodovastum atsumiense]|nr:protein of unknown function [Rhodovastum atsumiense]